MSWTKRQLVEHAFEELGLAAYAYDLTPDQLQSALRRLDAMMAVWAARGIKLFYPLPSSPENSELDEESGIPDAAADAVFTNLALRLAPSYGKSASAETRQTAKSGYDWLLNAAAMPDEMQYLNTLPLGAGGGGRVFVAPEEDNKLSGPTTEIDLL